MAHLDFVAAFSSPRAVELRLQAIDELEKLRPEYDEVIARALVHHDAGEVDESYDILRRAESAGRDDPLLRAFLDAIAP